MAGKSRRKNGAGYSQPWVSPSAGASWCGSSFTSGTTWTWARCSPAIRPLWLVAALCCIPVFELLDARVYYIMGRGMGCRASALGCLDAVAIGEFYYRLGRWGAGAAGAAPLRGVYGGAPPPRSTPGRRWRIRWYTPSTPSQPCWRGSSCSGRRPPRGPFGPWGRWCAPMWRSAPPSSCWRPAGTGEAAVRPAAAFFGTAYPAPGSGGGGWSSSSPSWTSSAPT